MTNRRSESKLSKACKAKMKFILEERARERVRAGFLAMSPEEMLFGVACLVRGLDLAHGAASSEVDSSAERPFR